MRERSRKKCERIERLKEKGNIIEKEKSKKKSL